MTKLHRTPYRLIIIRGVCRDILDSSTYGKAEDEQYTLHMQYINTSLGSFIKNPSTPHILYKRSPGHRCVRFGRAPRLSTAENKKGPQFRAVAA